MWKIIVLSVAGSELGCGSTWHLWRAHLPQYFSATALSVHTDKHCRLLMKAISSPGGDFNWQTQEPSYLTWWFGSINNRRQSRSHHTWINFQHILLNVCSYVRHWHGRKPAIDPILVVEWKGFWSCYLRNTKICNDCLMVRYVCFVSVKQLNINNCKFHFFFLQYVSLEKKKLVQVIIFLYVWTGALHTGTIFESDAT